MNSEKINENPLKVALDDSSPSVISIARVVVVTLVVLGVAQYLVGMLSALKGLLLIIVLSIFIAYLIDPLVNFIRRPFATRHLEKFMPRIVAIALAYAMVFVALGVGVSNLAPRVAMQGAELARNLPTYAKTVEETVASYNEKLKNLKLAKPVQDKITESSRTAVEKGGELITSAATGFAVGLLGFLPWLILIPVLSFLFLKDAGIIRAGILRLFPNGKWRSRAEEVVADINTTLAAYTRALLLSCLLIGVVCTVGFYLLGIQYALIFGILAGILEFIPLFGPLSVGIIVVGFTAFGEDPSNALPVAIFLIVLRLVHDYVTYPRIIREGIRLHPLAIILSLLAGEQIAGVIGIFLAIPIVALGTVLHRHVLEHSGSRGLVTEVLEEVEGQPIQHQ